MEEEDTDGRSSAPPSSGSSLVEDLEARRVEKSVRERLFGKQRPPIELERYTILDRVGAGASGVVYAAYDRRLDRKVALKVLRSRLGDTDQEIQAEGRSLARLAHPHVVTVHDVGVVDGQVYVAMEYIAGSTLREWLASDPRRSWRLVLQKLVDAGQGLAAVHRAGLVHRDFKPDNVLVDEDGWVRIVDFGLARATRNLLAGDAVDPRATVDVTRMLTTQVGEIAGTPAYMAPEQLQGRADAASDQYAFCVTVWEALFRERPFRGDSLEELAESVRGGTPAVGRTPRGLPGRVRRALLRGLRAREEERFPSLESLLGELEAARRQRPRRAVVGIAGLAAVAGVAAMLQARDPEPPGPCAVTHADFADVWGDRRAGALRNTVGPDEAQARDVLERLADSLSARRRSWETVDLRACKATLVDGRAPEAVYQTRTACLDRRMLEIDALVRSVEEDLDGPGTPYPALERGFDALDRLPLAEECWTVGEFATRAGGGRGQRDDTDLDGLERHLAEVRVLEAFGKNKEAREKAETVYERAQGRGAGRLRVEAAALTGRLALSLGELPVAEERLHEAARFGLGHGDLRLTTEAWVKLAGIGVRNNDFELAGRLGEYAEVIARRVDPDGPLVATVLAFRGWYFGYLGEFDRSRELQEGALALRRRILPANHTDIGRSLLRLGELWLDFGHPQTAISYYDDAIAVYADRGTPKHRGALSARTGLSVAWLKAGNPEKSLAMLDALAVDVTDRLGDQSELGAHLEERRGQALLALGRSEEALTTLEAAIEQQVGHGGGESPYMDLARTHLAQALHAVGRSDEAEATLRGAARHVADTLGDDDLFYGHAAHALGDLLMDTDRADEAVDWYRAAHHAFTSWREDGHLTLGLLKLKEARALAAAGRPDDARRSAASAMAILEAADGDDELVGEARSLAE